MQLVPQAAAAAWRVFFLCASVCLLFPLVLSLTLFTSAVVVLFFSLVMYSLTHPLRGVTTLFYFILFFLSILFFSFLYFIECVCRSLSYPVRWHDIARLLSTLLTA